MPIYLIKRSGTMKGGGYSAKLIRATGESPARKIAAKNAGSEGPFVWLDPAWTECEEIDPRGKQGEIIGSRL